MFSMKHNKYLYTNNKDPLPFDSVILIFNGFSPQNSILLALFLQNVIQTLLSYQLLLVILSPPDLLLAVGAKILLLLLLLLFSLNSPTLSISAPKPVPSSTVATIGVLSSSLQISYLQVYLDCQLLVVFQW